MRYLIVSLFLLGVGCFQTTNIIPTTVESGGGTTSSSGDPSVDDELLQDDKSLPVDGEILYKGFGEYFEDRFTGYHVAIDFEAPADTPVYAVEDGEVTYSGWVSGYGGVMVVRHEIDGRVVSAIYGHLDPASILPVGDSVSKGDQIAVLGEKGEETDGEREHLHFAIYEGEEVRLKGYETNQESVGDWLNPYDFVRLVPRSSTTSSEVGSDKIDRASSDLIYDGRDVFPLEFTVPAGWDVEYIPSIQSLSLYTLSGEGTARERSQMLIRYFDANSFLTLSTVTVFSTEDLTVGTGGYTARRYDIEKKPGVADFVDQPSWRNERHIVTDFRAEDGYTRYYVVAANPELDPSIYEEVLASMAIK